MLACDAAPAPRPAIVHRSVVAGRSVHGRPIRLVERGDAAARRRILVVGCIHGDECAGTALVRRLARRPATAGTLLWLVPTLDPDGRAAGTRQNARGVDLNRNFPLRWGPHGRPWDVYYGGPRPFSEPETRLARALVRRLRPTVTIWYHQHLRLVWAWGRSLPQARCYAARSGLRLHRRRSLGGTASRWQRARYPDAASYVVELPAGALTAQAARRHARAVLDCSR